ncbi:MAG: GH116 family glycosyl hydrolase [Pirellulales bacterium]
MNRRDFVQAVGAGFGLAAWGSGAGAMAGPFEAKDTSDHFVPLDKKLSAEWIRSLFERGERTWYAGNELATIGMPIGGVCAGQVYLSGDGRLVYWDVFNSNHNTGYGGINYKEGRKSTDVVTDGRFTPALDVAQGVAIQVKSGGRAVTRSLDSAGFKTVRFSGEYPLGFVEYQDSEVPIEVRLEAFSPFIPLNAADSALPVTVLNYTVKNTGDKPAEVALAGWLQNAVLREGGTPAAGAAVRVNEVVRDEGMTAVVGRAKALPQKKDAVREPIVFADFEADGYGDWIAEGEAFGTSPVKGTLPGQQSVSGYRGEKFVNSFVGGDDAKGKLVSPAFKIERPWIGFLIGGGQHAERACINLVIDGRKMRTATGLNREQLEPQSWDVREFLGKTARIEIVDAQSGGWGHINIDQIEFRDEPMGDQVPLRRRPDFGSMAIAVLGDNRTFATAALPKSDEKLAEAIFAAQATGKDDDRSPAEKPLDEALMGVAGRSFSLKPGEEKTATFLVGWHLPNNYREKQWVGNYYSKRFKDAGEVVRYVATNVDRLVGETRKWHRTYYDSTLPQWLLDRVGASTCNLATGTCQWWRNGRFWAWEGVGCCHGTCGHVWNYEHALARLFPELERSVRTMQDFVPGIGLDAATGSIGFRGEGWTLWAGDAQGGYILKAYREHLCSADDEFLNANWPNIRKAVEFLFSQDKNDDGLIEGQQHQTYDENYFGANTFVGALYLGALRAAEQMANCVGDAAFARRCRKVFEAGRDNSVKRLFNGEYYTQSVDLKAHPDFQYADGCLADHMFGQGWAHQVGLGYLYPPETVNKALLSIWKYNWAPDIALQNKHHDPERWFAMPGEAGLFMCTWPKGKHLGPKSTRYRDEVWTGTEYQVASHLAWEGMVTECLAMCRAVHERYHPAKRNPFNEIECGDHYARAMASWGVLIGLVAFAYDGPRGHIGFAPRMTPENFKAVFTAAEGWGSFEQRIEGGKLTARVEPRWGHVRLASLSLDLPPNKQLKSAKLRIGESVVAAKPAQAGATVRLEFPTDVLLDEANPLVCELQFA